jgi:threonine aldolase
MRTVDLRSDTVTLPTEAMFEAIRTADLGDDVYGEDPTVNRLEDLAARKVGKDAALFVTSGTQANLVALLSQTTPGDEVIMEANAHIYWNEAGGMAIIGGLLPRLVQGRRGILDPLDVEAAVRSSNIHYPTTSLVCIENTHNSAGGTYWTPEQIAALHSVTETRQLHLYMDGARLFNAAVAQDLPATELTRHVDSLMFCLSKSLSAPVGSIIAGTAAFVQKARKWRKLLGGGMRQAGVLAAPGIVALETMVDRLKEDHAHARVLAEGLAQLDGITLDLTTVQTNIIRFDVSRLGTTARAFIDQLRSHGIKAGGRGSRIRLVTHRMISRDDVSYVLDVVQRVWG